MLKDINILDNTNLPHLGEDIFSNVFTTGCSNILAFFPGNICADFVRHILAFFFRYILTYFHGGINTVLSRSVYTDLPWDWVAGNLRNIRTDLVFYFTLNYISNILADLLGEDLHRVVSHPRASWAAS